MLMNSWCTTCGVHVYSFDDASSISSGDISDAINGFGIDDPLTPQGGLPVSSSPFNHHHLPPSSAPGKMGCGQGKVT